jgi:hypothetical protein
MPQMIAESNLARPKDGIFRLIVADIAYLAGAFEKSANQMAREVGITRHQWRVLTAAAAGQRSVPQLARRMDWITKHVQELQAISGLAASQSFPNQIL